MLANSLVIASQLSNVIIGLPPNPVLKASWDMFPEFTLIAYLALLIKRKGFSQ